MDIQAKAVRKEAKTQADLVINIIKDAVIVTNEITKFIEEEWMDYATFIVCYPNIRAYSIKTFKLLLSPEYQLRRNCNSIHSENISIQ